MKKLILSIAMLTAGVLLGAPARADIIRARPGIPPRFNVMDSMPPQGRLITPKALKSMPYGAKRAPKGFR